MVVVTTSLAALQNGEQVELHPGDILRVAVDFDYKIAETTTVTLWGSLGLGFGRDIENFKEITLERALTFQHVEETIDIEIPSSGKTDGTYWLQAEIQGYGDTQVRIDDAVIISGMAEDMWGLIGAILPLMLMVMMMSMVSGMTKEGG